MLRVVFYGFAADSRSVGDGVSPLGHVGPPATKRPSSGRLQRAAGAPRSTNPSFRRLRPRSRRRGASCRPPRRAAGDIGSVPPPTVRPRPAGPRPAVQARRCAPADGGDDGLPLGSGRWHDGDVPIDAARTERLVASSSPTSPTQRILGRLGYLDFVEVDNAIHHGTPRMGKWNLVGAAPVCVLLSALRVSLSRENRDDVDY